MNNDNSYLNQRLEIDHEMIWNQIERESIFIPKGPRAVLKSPNQYVSRRKRFWAYISTQRIHIFKNLFRF